MGSIRQAARDLDSGYTINEDNAAYERYPYQIKKEWVTAALSALDVARAESPEKTQ